jgi:hypothetical protein
VKAYWRASHSSRVIKETGQPWVLVPTGCIPSFASHACAGRFSGRVSAPMAETMQHLSGLFLVDNVNDFTALELPSLSAFAPLSSPVLQLLLRY